MIYDPPPDLPPWKLLDAQYQEDYQGEKED